MPSRTKPFFNIKDYANNTLRPNLLKELDRDDFPRKIITLGIHDFLAQFIRFEYVRRNEDYHIDWKEYREYMSGKFSRGKRFDGLIECGNSIIDKWGIMEVSNPSKPLKFQNNIPVWSNDIESQTPTRSKKKDTTVRIYKPTGKSRSVTVKRKYSVNQFSAIINLNQEYHGNAANYPASIPKTGYYDKFAFTKMRPRLEWDCDKWELMAANKNAPFVRIKFEMECFLNAKKSGRKPGLKDHIKYLFFYDAVQASSKGNEQFKTRAKITDEFFGYHRTYDEKNFNRDLDHAKENINGGYNAIDSVTNINSSIKAILKTLPK